MKWHLRKIILSLAILSVSRGIARAAFIAVGDYDEQTNSSNSVDIEATNNNISLADFKTLVTDKFADGLGGVINFESYVDAQNPWTTDRPNFNVSFASGTKTLTIARTAGNFGWGAGNEFAISGSGVNSGRWIAFASPASPATFTFSMNGDAAPVVAWGITGIARSTARTYGASVTLNDDTVVQIGTHSVPASSLTDDVFFGYQAEIGKTIKSVTLTSLNQSNAAATSGWDDMAFVLAVPEPTSIYLFSLGSFALVAIRRRHRK